MQLVAAVCLLFAVGCAEQQLWVAGEPVNAIETAENGLADTDLVQAFVVFRHGDRTPDQEELDLFPSNDEHPNVFFPYGKKSLTNVGKQRGYLVGEYLRERYNGLVSRLYLQDEVSIRSTDFARTKMTALTATAGLYPPPAAQRWNPALNWQPVPYNVRPYHEDDLLYWYNCPRYLWLRNQVYEFPEVKKRLKSYQGLFSLLSHKTGTNITTPEDVFFLDNLFQALENVNLPPPKWAEELMPKIKAMTKIEYGIEFYNPELIRLAAGVQMGEILNATQAAINGRMEQPKLWLYSAHENNVAALMAAAGVFEPHQPNYGATFSLELRRRSSSGQYGIAAVYSPEAGGPEQVLPITGCGSLSLCDYETFVSLVLDVVWTYNEFSQQCNKLS